MANDVTHDIFHSHNVKDSIFVLTSLGIFMIYTESIGTNLYMNEQKEEGVKENPNNTIWNLTTRVLSNEEYQVLCYGLNHGLATYQKQNDILASVETVWDQINKKNICKETQNHIERAKNSLRALAFSFIDLDNYEVFKNKRKLAAIKNLRKKLVILKPDKGNRIALIGTNEFYIMVENLFSDKSKFKEIHDDPTPARLSSIQRYLKNSTT